MAKGGASGGKASDVRAGGAFVEISVREHLTKTFASLQRRAQAFGAGLRAIGAAGIGLGAVALAPLAALLKGGVDRAERIQNMGLEIGFASEQMQRLAFAADVAGASIDDVLKNPGRFKDLMDGAPIMDPATIKASVQANQEMRKVWIELQTALVPLMEIITPIVKAVADWVKENKGLAQIGFILSSVLIGLGASAVVLGAAISGVVAIVSAIGAVLGVVSLKFLLVAAVVGGAVYAFVKFTDSGKKLFSELGGALQVFYNTVESSIQGIRDSIAAGDLPGALKIATLGMTAVWYEMLVKMGAAFAEFIRKNRDEFVAIGVLMGGAAGAMGGSIFGPWGTVIGGGAGAVGGGIAADRLADKIEAMGDNPELQAKLVKAQAELREALGKARDAAAAAEQKRNNSFGDMMTPAITAARGSFRLLSSPRQQFGEGNPLVALARDQLQVQKGIEKGVANLEQLFKIK